MTYREGVEAGAWAALVGRAGLHVGVVGVGTPVALLDAGRESASQAVDDVAERALDAGDDAVDVVRERIAELTEEAALVEETALPEVVVRGCSRKRRRQPSLSTMATAQSCTESDTTRGTYPFRRPEQPSTERRTSRGSGRGGGRCTRQLSSWLALLVEG